MEVVKFQKLRNVKSPVRGTSLAAGIDFFIPNDANPILILPGFSAFIPSGIRVKIPHGYALVAMNKSGIALKGLQVGACVVDEDYTGEVHLHVHNISKSPIRLTPGTKLVQFVLLPVSYAAVEEDPYMKFGPTERGEGKCGSTGLYE